MALSEFHKDKSRQFGRSFKCKSCDTKKTRKWAKANPSKYAASSRRYRERNPEKWAETEFRSRLKTKYGITVERFEAMLANQGGLCASCKQKPDGALAWQGLVVDHDHDTKKVRALLCSPCNLAIGLAKECPARLRSAADYVESHTRQ